MLHDGDRAQPTLLIENIGEKSDVPLVSPTTAELMRGLMRQLIEKGTGRKAQVPGIVIYGKTGTANHRCRHGTGYQKKDVSTTFVGAFPETPRYGIFVLLDQPQGIKSTYYFNSAGWNTAPVAGRIIKRVVTTLGIESDSFVEEKNAPLIRLASIKE